MKGFARCLSGRRGSGKEWGAEDDADELLLECEANEELCALLEWADEEASDEWASDLEVPL